MDDIINVIPDFYTKSLKINKEPGDMANSLQMEFLLSDDDTNHIRVAFEIASQKHKNQKYGEHPYIHHLFDVARTTCSILSEAGVVIGWKVICGSILHDIIEDQNYPAELIEAELGLEVADIVEFCTKDDEINKHDNLLFLCEKIEMIDTSCRNDIDKLTSKVSDRISNSLRCIENHKTKKRLINRYKNESSFIIKSIEMLIENKNSDFNPLINLLVVKLRQIDSKLNKLSTQNH